MTTRHERTPSEWMSQAHDDLSAARHLLEGGHDPYVGFLAHLAVEKALKAVYRHRTREHAPVTHDLLYLTKKTELLVPDELHPVIEQLNHVSILHLYPESDPSHPFSDPEEAKRLMVEVDELMEWISAHLPEDLA